MIYIDVFMLRAADSAKMVSYWDLTDTLEAGVDAMRMAREKYLPKFPSETDGRYTFRVESTKFTNIYRDIVEALASKPFEEPVSFKDDAKPPKEIEEFTYDVDGAGTDITTFAAAKMFSGINSAIDWIFVDYPNVGPEVKTIADQKSAGVRPFWSHVLGRNVLEAKARVVAGNERLIYIRIYEPGSPDHVRVFRRTGEIVTWALFRRMERPHKITPDERSWLETVPTEDIETYFTIVDQGVLSIPEIPLVPFWTGRRHGRTFCFSPAMRDAAELQIEVYQEESGLKFACIMAAFPMLAGNGIKPEMEADGKTPKQINVGPGNVLYSLPDGLGNIGKWEYVQPDAAVLKFLHDKVDKTIQNLRELGRQPLTSQAGNLTVITTAVAAGKAKSAVAAWAGALGFALDNALRLTAMFLGLTEDIPSVHVYDDFDNFDINGDDVTALNFARGKRDISGKRYTSELKRRRILADDYDYDEDQAELLNETPGEEFEDEDA